MKKRYLAITMVIFVSAIISSVASLGFEQGLTDSGVFVYFSLLLRAGIYFFLFVILVFLLPKIRINFNIERFRNLIPLSFDKKSIFQLCSILLILHIPYLLIFFPGTLGWDTTSQIQDFFNGTGNFIYYHTEVFASLDDHHPIFDTIIFGIFIWIGRSLGNAFIGCFLYSFIQMFLMFYAISYAICYMEKLGGGTG